MNRSDRQPPIWRLMLALLTLISTVPVQAGRPTFSIEIRNHLFVPEQLVIPANTRVKLLVYNRDPTPEEFESYELNREKVIMGQHKAAIFIGPLAPRDYPYFGEFHPATAIGNIQVK